MTLLLAVVSSVLLTDVASAWLKALMSDAGPPAVVVGLVLIVVGLDSALTHRFPEA